jgi:rhodanese-related sulfurtransferase
MQPLDDAPKLVERIERITAKSLAEQLESSAPPLPVDVRTEREYQEGWIDGALNIPLSQLPQRIEELPTDRMLVPYCTSGYRSMVGASLIRRDGPQSVANLVGGLSAWEASSAS